MLAKKNKQIKLSSLFENLPHNIPDSFVFINDKLTKHFNYLYKKARDFKRERKVKYAWVRDGKIFVRKEDNSKVVRIIDLTSFNDVTN